MTARRRTPDFGDEWFVIDTFDISTSSRTGPLGEYWLHPLAMPNTPYAAKCQNCTHRVERRWSFRIYVTTAATTGCRVGCLALPDTNYIQGTISSAMVWGAIANNRGTMVDSSGNMAKTSTFGISGSTRALSNSDPPDNHNMMGYANAILIVFLLNPPIAITSTTTLSCTILGKCDVMCLNRLPGYLASQAPMFQPTVGDQGGPPDWMLVIDQAYYPNSVLGTWSTSHTGDAWLAGGFYFVFYKSGEHAPNEVRGEPRIGSVYTTDAKLPPWETNNNMFAAPIYFAIFRHPSGYDYLVGFTNIDWAGAQASGNTGMVPSGAELCIKYRTQPKWGDMFTGNLIPLTGTNMTGPKFAVMKFWQVLETAPPLGRPVYSTMNALPHGDYYSLDPPMPVRALPPPQLQPVNRLVARQPPPPPVPAYPTLTQAYPGYPFPMRTLPGLQDSSSTPLQTPTLQSSWAYTNNIRTNWQTATTISPTRTFSPMMSTVGATWRPLTASTQPMMPTTTGFLQPSTSYLSQINNPSSSTMPYTVTSSDMTPGLEAPGETRQTNLESSSAYSQRLYTQELDGIEEEDSDSFDDSETQPSQHQTEIERWTALQPDLQDLQLQEAMRQLELQGQPQLQRSASLPTGLESSGSESFEVVPESTSTHSTITDPKTNLPVWAKLLQRAVRASKKGDTGE
uniref:RNA-dependent RNA polymerase n=1 Tax=Somov virus TaxID=2707269 RepID=A0A6H0DGW4_9VIRU|nr:MAG: RNA-dependent RNA polymerase [Somov virus]